MHRSLPYIFTRTLLFSCEDEELRAQSSYLIATPRGLKIDSHCLALP